MLTPVSEERHAVKAMQRYENRVQQEREPSVTRDQSKRDTASGAYRRAEEERAGPGPHSSSRRLPPKRFVMVRVCSSNV
jgi:hypothetical protein